MMALQNHYPLIRHWKDVYDMVREVDSPWLKICLDLPMMTRFDPEFVRQAALTVGDLQVHSHFGGEFTRVGRRPASSQHPFDFEKPLPDYGQFLGLMREIGYDGYLCYELCHPFLNDRHELHGLDAVDEQASLPASSSAACWRRETAPRARRAPNLLAAERDDTENKGGIHPFILILMSGRFSGSWRFHVHSGQYRTQSNSAAIAARHPLEPLMRREVAPPSICSSTTARSRRPRGSSPSPQGAGQIAGLRVKWRTAPRARRSPSSSTTPPTPATRRRVSLTDGKLLALEARPRRAADDDHRRAGRVRAGRARQPRVQGGAQEALRHRRHAAWSWSISGARATTASRGGPHAPARPAALLPPHRPDRQRLRPADRGPAPGRRPQHDGGDPRRGVRPLAAAAAGAATTPPTACRDQRDRHQAAGDHAARGAELRGRGLPGARGRSGASSSASTPARG